MTITEYSIEDWWSEGRRRFGTDQKEWRFVCPLCNSVTSVGEWIAAGAPDGAIAFSCVGRWKGVSRDGFGVGDGPCNYAGGGLFTLNPVEVAGRRLFDFADAKKGKR